LLHAIGECGFPVVELGGAGRTDAGVHALEQCAHLRLSQRVEPAELARALNRRLPHDVNVLGVEKAPHRFHSRHDALLRSYLYQVSRRRNALFKRFLWWVRDPLDLDALRTGAATLVGRHDFGQFCERDEKTASTIVVVERVEVVAEGDLVLLRFVASHFLWKMVRRLVGTLAAVATGRLRQGELALLLGGKAPTDPALTPARLTAPAAGLFLERVLYAGDPPLAALLPVTRTSTALASSRPMLDAPPAAAASRGTLDPSLGSKKRKP
jgi:tRNA pseudouridine38-40 synthase